MNRSLSVLLLENIHIEALSPPKALAFDLDLTIHDVIAHYNHSVNQTIIHFGFKELTAQELRQLSGIKFVNTRNIFAEFLPAKLVDPALKYYYDHFLKSEILPEVVLPGARELLYLLRKRFKLPIVAISNLEENLARKILENLNLTGLFDYIVGIRKDTNFKPDPQMLLMALEHIKIQPGPHVWFVGDMPTDVECAKRANCTAIRFYHKIDPQDPDADLSINNHYHLFNIINDKLKNPIR